MINFVLSNGYFALIDTADVALVRDYRWYKSSQGYAVTSVGKIRMHKLLTGYAMTDHINGNRLDNRRSNLRPVNRQTNGFNAKLSSANTTGNRGVRVGPNGRYRAYITVDRRQIHLGSFNGIDEAIKARKAAELKFFGEYSALVCRPEDY